MTAADTQHIQVAIGNQVADLGVLSVGASETAALGNLNTALQSNALTRAAGISAVDNGGKIELISNNSTNFRLNAYGQTTNGFGFTDCRFCRLFGGRHLSQAPRRRVQQPRASMRTAPRRAAS